MTQERKTIASRTVSQTGSFAMCATSCFGENEILAFAQGLLDEAAMDALHDHVDVCATCQRLVSEAVHALEVTPVPESARPSWNTIFQPNSIVARRYRVVRLIARGGMGEVYEAYDTALHERVAIKTVTSTACDSLQAVSYLKAEVQLARRVSHPNVCRIYDLGTHATDVSGADINFLVMEYVEGECLGKRLRQSGPLPFEAARSVALQLLQGLRAAHRAGILHRDFKSDNVMLRSEANGAITPVILDFGLAKAFNDNGRISISQHHGQSLVGTIGYMAPEQIEGAPLSAASDLYAFGVVWFEMLTGRLPFEEETPAAAALARLYRPPTSPSKLNSSIPPQLEALILKCLNRDRSARFTDAEQVIHALTAVDSTLAGQREAKGSPLGRSTVRLVQLPFRRIAAGLAGVALVTWGLRVLFLHPASRAVVVPQAQPASFTELRPSLRRERSSPDAVAETADTAAPAKTTASRASGNKLRAQGKAEAARAVRKENTELAPLATQAVVAPSGTARSKGSNPDWLPLWNRAPLERPTAAD